MHARARRVLPDQRRVAAHSPKRYRVRQQRIQGYGVAGLGGREVRLAYLHALPARLRKPQYRGKEVIGRCTRPYGSLPPLTVRSLTTVDLSVTYEFDNGLRLRVGGRNVLKAEMPTIWRTLPYDPTRWDARGRVLFLELTWET
ncbi:MAG: TonB-dependent receptor [Gammaproteobacteria bacterium]|nr:TonB-dependent receptor [Gammaproteobacteria bacterium]